MSRLRMTSDRRVEAAIEELVSRTAGAHGLGVTRTADDQVEVTVGAQRWPAKVIARDAVSRRDAQGLVETEARGSKIVVANRISADAKEFLAHRNEASPEFGWSWLDRRGELQLNHHAASGVVNFDLDALDHNPSRPGGWGLSSPRSDGPIRGRAGIGYAAARLLDPTERPSIRAVAKKVEMSHGAVGDAAKLLRQDGLIRRDGEPEIPDLFWALADAWGATRITPISRIPDRRDAERLDANIDDLGEIGWGLGGDEAALAWGAPLFMSGSRPWIWAPTDVNGRQATRALGTATWDECAAVIAVAPTLLVCGTRRRSPGAARPEILPTVHPLFLALELAQDPGRGREILDGWNPDQTDVHRVW